MFVKRILTKCFCKFVSMFFVVGSESCPPSLEGGGPLAVEDFFYTLCLRRPTFVCQQQKWAKMPLGSLRNFK